MGRMIHFLMSLFQFEKFYFAAVFRVNFKHLLDDDITRSVGPQKFKFYEKGLLSSFVVT